ncbi:MAG: hypothetical protein Ctma_1412 [Catillopecten margaritatus gill symbiont]|uniref:Uncharacterized protein n=1 Tax=Catillopecten margaritatus gill symbiont TaxID=3083288 RepID=A0AAU6PI64_9GAMM
MPCGFEWLEGFVLFVKDPSASARDDRMGCQKKKPVIPSTSRGILLSKKGMSP